MKKKTKEVKKFGARQLLCIVLCVFSALLVGSAVIVNSFAFSSLEYVVQDQALNSFLSEASNNHATSFYANSIFDDNEKGAASSMFTTTYRDNLANDGFQRIMTVSNDNAVFKMSTKFNDMEIPFKSAVTNSGYYTNRKEPPAFETVSINLFMYRDKKEEITYDPKVCSGFVYIPDYFADYIIENSEEFSSYQDLFTSINYFVFENGSNFYRYKIANIFARTYEKDKLFL